MSVAASSAPATAAIQTPENAIQQFFSNDENSYLLDYKALSCLPFIGTCWALIVQVAIKDKLTALVSANNPGNANRIVQLIDLKNDHKVGSAISRFFFISLLATAIALKIIAKPLFIGVASLSIAANVFAIGTSVHNVFHNRQTANEYRQNGSSSNGVR